MHNHTSGESNPSDADVKVTRDSLRAGQVLKLELPDCGIIGNGNVRRCGSLVTFLPEQMPVELSVKVSAQEPESNEKFWRVGANSLGITRVLLVLCVFESLQTVSVHG